MKYLIPLLFTLAMPVFAAKKSAPNPDQELKNREYMIEISRQLGVTCNYCHDVKNFRTSTMKTWKTGQAHMHIVDLLNQRGFNTTGIKADCYMCHRGKAHPDYKEAAPTAPTPNREEPEKSH